MALFDKVTVKLLQKALSAYLPMTRTEVVRIASPNVAALRVWFEEDSARDYFTDNRSWYQVHALTSFSSEPHNLYIGAGTGMQLISATIASDIAHWHRPVVFPLPDDMFPRTATNAEREASTTALAASLQFLTALSNGMLPFTDRADQLAAVFLKDLMGQIERSQEGAAGADASSPAEDEPVVLLQRALAEDMPLIETEFMFLGDQGIWALSLDNLPEYPNWFAKNDEGWFDNDGELMDYVHGIPVNYDLREVELHIAFVFLLRLSSEFSEKEPIEHENLLADIMLWVIEVRNDIAEPLSSSAAYYLSAVEEAIQTERSARQRRNA